MMMIVYNMYKALGNKTYCINFNCDTLLRLCSPAVNNSHHADLSRRRLSRDDCCTCVMANRSEGFALTGYGVPGCLEDGTWVLCGNSSAAVGVLTRSCLDEFDRNTCLVSSLENVHVGTCLIYKVIARSDFNINVNP